MILIKIENLSEGLIVKNYKELCSLLDVPIKTGNAKIAQIKEFERYFNYDKEKNSFIIKEVYKVPLPPNNNITQYVPLIEQLILHIIITQSDKDNRLYIHKNKLLTMLKMINNEYSNMKYKNMQLSKTYNIPKQTIIDFYSTSDSLLKRNIETALNNLKDRSLIQWSNVFSVCELELSGYNLDMIEIKEYVNKFGDSEKVPEYKSKNIVRKYRESTKEETEYILQLQAYHLDKLECETISEVYKKGLSEEFYNRVNSVLLSKRNIEMYFQSYSIIYNMEYVVKRYNKADIFLLDDESRVLTATLLNSEIMNKINNNAIDRHNKAVKNKGNTYFMEYRKEKQYIEHIEKLTDSLIMNNKYIK